MSDSRRFLHPEAIRRVSRLDLRARLIVEGFLAGSHRSPYFGNSIEFLQHREYVPGDDLRHVDWKVWARQDRYYVKQYEEETNLRCYLLVDRSSSMRYGSGTFNKYEYAATLAACLSFLVLRQQDAVGLGMFDRQIRGVVPAASRSQQLSAITDWLERSPGEDDTSDMPTVFQRAAELFPRRGLFIVLSDLLGEPSAILRGLRLLRQQGHDVSVLQILDDDELDFDFSGATRFEDLESNLRLTCNPRALREGYLQALREFLDQLKRGCGGASIDYQLVRTQQNVAAALAEFLSSRLDRVRT